MKDSVPTTIEEARAVMRAAPESQKIALAIELANAISDPRQAAGLLRLGRESLARGETMIRDQYLRGCG